ncbi:MAG: AI-2E family transporter [Alphaproteobacteria bacterium]
MDTTVRASLLFLSFVTATACLYLTRDLLAPLALAIFIWLIIDAFARWLDRLSPKFPYWLALTVAILSVVAALIGVVVVIINTAADVINQAPKYEARLREIFTQLDGVLSNLGGMFRMEDVGLKSLIDQINPEEKISQVLGGIVGSIQGVGSEFILIAIYVAFLFAAQSSFPKKMDDLFPDQNRRAQAAKVGRRIRHSIEKYIGVQTVISMMQTVVSYVAMTALGLENALFWALVIFVLNYIPIIGGFIAVALPSLFALVEFDSSGRVALLVGLLFGAQFVIGNTIQPKMMGDSMNLSALVVVLSLTLWGALWGGVGAFLSAPLTVIIMIILAQFPTTRWIAVLLSSDGEPDVDEDDKKKASAIPSL